MKFLEDFAALDHGNADAGIKNPNLQGLAVAPATDQHAPARGVFDGVGDQILQQPPQQQPIGLHRKRAGHETQFKSLGAGDRCKLDFQRTHQVAHLETGDRRRHGAGVQPRNIQESAKDLLDGFQRLINVFDQSRVFAAVLALHQACGIEPCRVERLQNVVACGSEKSRLGDAGVFGRALRLRQLGIQPGQLLGAVAHPLFQRRIGALQRFGRLERGRDVSEGDDEAAAGHAVGQDLDHHVAVGQALEIRLAVGGVSREPALQHGLALDRIVRLAHAHEFQDFAQRRAELDEMRGNVEQIAELPVGADQLQIGIEHRDALAHMVERGLEDLAVEMQRRMGIVEQLERSLGRHRPFAQQQRHHET